MEIIHYTYDDFLIYSLSYFGLSSIVEKKIESHTLFKEVDLPHALLIIEDCKNMDLFDRAETFRKLYRRFYKKRVVTKDKLITDMLSYCA
jgi:hypothetical protein